MSIRAAEEARRILRENLLAVEVNDNVALAVFLVALLAIVVEAPRLLLLAPDEQVAVFNCDLALV